MFEIGNSLREARLRQGLDLAEIEQATKIRSRYLRALEEEQFELLPAQTYVKGFLKAYADQLGLDGDLYVEEFNSRYATEEEPVQHGRGGGGGSWPGPVRLQSSAVLISLTAIGLAAALVIVAWRFGATDEPEDIPGLPPAAAEQTPKQTTRAQRQPQRSNPKTTVRRVSLVAVAARGDCWLEVHRGSSAGELLYDGTLESGRRTTAFKGKQLWINVGAPSNVVLLFNNRRTQLPGSGAPRALIVNRRGVALAG
jgi:transcriptional regulator with XRE-family HTH domain